MSNRIATPRACFPLLLSALSMALAPQAFAGFELIDNAPAPAPVPYVASSGQSQDTAQMQQTINALRQEIQGLRVRLAAAQAEATDSRQELLAIRARQDQIQTSIDHMTITFAFGHAGFSPGAAEAKALLQAAQRAMQVRISGYTDSVGSIEANRRVAQLRAEAAKVYLVRRGIAASRIIAEGRAGHYIASNGSADGRAANRRVEFEFLDTYR